MNWDWFSDFKKIKTPFTCTWAFWLPPRPKLKKCTHKGDEALGSGLLALLTIWENLFLGLDSEPSTERLGSTCALYTHRSPRPSVWTQVESPRWGQSHSCRSVACTRVNSCSSCTVTPSQGATLHQRLDVKLWSILVDGHLLTCLVSHRLPYLSDCSRWLAV